MSILADSNNELTNIYLAISTYNNLRDRCYINEEFKIKLKQNGNNENKISDKTVFHRFLLLFQQEINSMVDLQKNFLTLSESEKIITQLRVFVEKSTEIDDKKNDTELLDSLTNDVLNKSTGIKELINKSEKNKPTSKEFGKIHDYIKKSAEELIMARDIIFCSYLEYLQLLLIQEIKKYNVTIKRTPKRLPVIDWDNSAVSPEDFAINSTLEKTFQKSMELCRIELVKVFDKIGMQPVVKMWQLYFAHQKIFDLSNKLIAHFNLVHDHAENETFILPEFQRIYKTFMDTQDAQQLNEAIHVSEETFVDVQKSSNQQLYTLSIEYTQTLETIKETYHKAYLFYHASQSNYNVHSLPINPAFGKHFLSLEELESIHIPQITPDLFQNRFSENLDALLNMTMHDSGALVFKTVQQWLYGDSGHEFVDFHKSSCHELQIHTKARSVPEQDILAYRIEHLKITNTTPLKSTPKPTNSKKQTKTSTKQIKKPVPKKPTNINVKKEVLQEIGNSPLPPLEVIQDIQTVVEKTLPKDPPPILPTAPIIIHNYTSIKDAEKITVDPRVRDWLRNSPETLKQTGYANLSQQEQQEAKLFHSYPIVITKLMKQYGQSTPRMSNKTKQTNTLFSYPGTIERYGTGQKRTEGYFADCFDVKTNHLYHHYFHARPFRELIDRYKTSSTYLTTQEEKAIRDTDFFFPKNNEPIEEENLHGKLNVTVRHYSIEVDDTENKIKYSLAFPEGVTI